MKNHNLHNAKRNKNDEFMTQMVDIEKELRHYKEHFQGKVVYCNCDDENSNFVKYFNNNTEIKQLLYSSNDFRSDTSIELLKQADIVVTNPPFSLFREYVAQLMEYKKKFLIIGNMNAITYKEIFPLIKENKLWFGPSISSGDREFGVPDSYPLEASSCRIDEKGNKFIRVKGVRWFTNLPHAKRNEELIPVKRYKGNEEDYPKYDNYDAINVDKTKDIPADYDGVIGVPITFLDKYNPEQFEIVGNGQTMANELGIKPVGQKFVDDYYAQGNKGQINAKWNNLVYHIGAKVVVPYQRILIRRKGKPK